MAFGSDELSTLYLDWTCDLWLNAFIFYVSMVFGSDDLLILHSDAAISLLHFAYGHGVRLIELGGVSI